MEVRQGFGSDPAQNVTFQIAQALGGEERLNPQLEGC